HGDGMATILRPCQNFGLLILLLYSHKVTPIICVLGLHSSAFAVAPAWAEFFLASGQLTFIFQHLLQALHNLRVH
ncbi:hypothetical protein ACK36C_20450, partial [Aeromonas veronii]